MTDSKPDSVKREWNISDGDFLFEIVHIGEPASNMSTFHWRDFMKLSYIQENEGRYEIEERVYQVAKGDVVIINNIERHRVTYKGDKPLYETVIHFDPKLIWFKEDPTMEFGFLKLLTVIALLLRECRVEAVDEGVFQSRQNQIDRLKRILAYIDDNFSREIGLESTAAQFQFNASYFSDYFKKSVGITFSEYLSRARVREAIKLMTENGASSTDAAYECGFNNIASFYAACKRVTGTNPGDYLRAK